MKAACVAVALALVACMACGASGIALPFWSRRSKQRAGASEDASSGAPGKGPTVLMLGGANFMDGQIIPSDTMQTMELVNGSKSILIKACHKLPMPMYYVGAAIYNDQVIVGGGYTHHVDRSFDENDDNPMLTMTGINATFKWSNGGWSHWNYFSTIAGEAHLLTVQGTLYAVGRCANGASMCLEQYHDGKKKWMLTQNQPPKGIQYPGVTTHNNAILLVGGLHRDEVATRIVAHYSTADGQWKPLPKLNLPRKAPAVGTANNHLCVAGGVQDLTQFSGRTMLMAMRSAECLDMQNQDSGWHMLPLLPESRGSGTMFSVNGRIFLVGGVTFPLRWLSNNHEDDDVMSGTLNTTVLSTGVSLGVPDGTEWAHLDISASASSTAVALLPSAASLALPNPGFGPCPGS